MSRLAHCGAVDRLHQRSRGPGSAVTAARKDEDRARQVRALEPGLTIATERKTEASSARILSGQRRITCAELVTLIRPPECLWSL